MYDFIIIVNNHSIYSVSNIVEEIKKPINEEMKLFEQKFYESMQSKVALLDKVTRFIVTTKGKQMRPMFVFLTSKMLGEITDKTFDAAALVELLHTATLVHDDVVDDANERRGFFSINALWKNKIAVLVGDYMLSKVLLLDRCLCFKPSDANDHVEGGHLFIVQ